MYYTYILQSLKDRKYYIGFTDNLKRRVAEHNNGRNFSTSPRKPFKLIYYEAYIHIQDAKDREKYYKTGWGRNHIKKILKHYLSQKI